MIFLVPSLGIGISIGNGSESKTRATFCGAHTMCCVSPFRKDCSSFTVQVKGTNLKA
jgi:hypothetical protein